MKGIVLAGGSGTRLYPITKGISKQLIPVYDKPMIYYPLSVLMLAGIRDIMVISTPDDLPSFRRLLSTGEDIGVRFEYACQPRPEGLAQAFIIAEQWLGDEAACLVLGDNIFYGQGFTGLLQRSVKAAEGGMAVITGYPVSDPRRFGVVVLDGEGRPVAIEEKPASPRSNLAVPGLYFYPSGVASVAHTVQPSARGELEITAVNEHYLQSRRLRVERLGRGFAWLDTGTVDSLADATGFIEAIQQRQGVQVAALEEIAFRKGWIDKAQLLQLARPMTGNDYGRYLEKLARADEY